MTARTTESSILYQNSKGTVFVLDLPCSIAQAQEPSAKATSKRKRDGTPESPPTFESLQDQYKKYPLSKPAFQKPHPSPSEPKSEAARQRLLARIPPSECGTLEYQQVIIEPLVKKSLDEIYSEYLNNSQYRDRTDQWVLPRLLFDETSNQKQQNNEQIEFPTRHKNGVPPTILSPTSATRFATISDLAGVVKNPSTRMAEVSIGRNEEPQTPETKYQIPPKSNFVLCEISLSRWSVLESPIPGLSQKQRFNLILMDPPWPNRSVRRSQAYQITSYTDLETLKQRLKDILRTHAYRALPPRRPLPRPCKPPATNSPPSTESSKEGFAAIWITGSHKTRAVAYESLLSSGFKIYEEWIWIKITAQGEPVSPVDGLWRKPYEVLVIGRKDQAGDGASLTGSNCASSDSTAGVDADTIPRRVIAAAPDFHSRKPSLKFLFERYLFNIGPAIAQDSHEVYSALEVFARHLTAGWWACGNEVMKFNDCDFWGARSM